MALVTYSDSEGEEQEDQTTVVSPTTHRQSSIPPKPKRRRLSRDKKDKAPLFSASPPPLPASFHSLYSSSVRVSTRDDPSLHGGRKRIVPHIPGNWATHVYLEWLPNSSQHTLLTNLITAVTNSSILSTTSAATNKQSEIHSLLETPLGVTTPLHISLSAPLVLRTETKDSYLSTLLASLTPIANAYKPAITTTPDKLSWHLNEDGSRGFLVLRVLEIPHHNGQGNRALPNEQEQEGGEEEKQRGPDLGFALSSPSLKERSVIDTAAIAEEVGRVDGEQSGLWRRHGQAQYLDAQTRGRGDGSSSGQGLNDLLNASNKVAKAFGQPELYVAKERDRSPSASLTARGDFSGYFHVSIAWALTIPASRQSTATLPPQTTKAKIDTVESEYGGHDGGAWAPEAEEVLEEIKKMRITFDEVKVRIGKDVTDIPFGAKKRSDMKPFFGT